MLPYHRNHRSLRKDRRYYSMNIRPHKAFFLINATKDGYDLQQKTVSAYINVKFLRFAGNAILTL